MTVAFLNGRFLSDQSPLPGEALGDARISAFDAGVQHGVGLFETMLGGVRASTPDADPADRAAWVYRLDEHLARLKKSAHDLGLSESLNTAALAEAVLQTIERSGLERARVRLTITGGDLNLLVRRPGEPGAGHDPTVLIVAQPATDYPQAMFDRGTSVVINDARANPLNPFEGHKTLGYWWRLRGLQAAASRGAGEAIVLQVSNHLAGGCVSNLFIARGGTLYTPIARGGEHPGAMSSPVLPGITRSAIIELAKGRGVECVTQMLSVQEMLDADEVFLTNSSWGVLPVVGVLGLGEKRAIGDGVPGSLSRELRQLWLDEVRRAAMV